MFGKRKSPEEESGKVNNWIKQLFTNPTRWIKGQRDKAQLSLSRPTTTEAKHDGGLHYTKPQGRAWLQRGVSVTHHTLRR